MNASSHKSKQIAFSKPRSAGGALGGLLGAIVMSVIAGLLLTVAVTPVVALTGAAASTAVGLFESLPGNLRPGELALPTTLFAKNTAGEKVKIAEFYDQDRVPVDWNNISQYVKDAVVAVEDPRFFTHGGVDVLATSRAVLQNSMGKSLSGASTLTMQYVRNVLVQEATAIPDEKLSKKAYENAMRQDFDRKLKEMKLAISLEKKNTKADIMVGYLNIVLFGRQVYGIEAAARFYYGTTAKDLTLPQAASLVAIVNSPSRYQIDIPENLEANKTRRDLILGRMLQHGKITQQQHDEAVATPVEPHITQRLQGCEIAENEYGLGHFCDYIKHRLRQDPEFGPDPITREFNIKRGGYEIMTTIDLDMQKAATEASRKQVPGVMDGIDAATATVSTEPNTGKILVMAQNRPFSNDPNLGAGYTAINYSTDYADGGSAGFQVGSTFKPITLAEWIRTGHSVRDGVNVNGRTVQLASFKAKCMDGGVYGYGPWRFHNDNLGVRGHQSVLTTIAQSLNGGVVSMQQKMDLCDTFELAKKLGIHRASKQESDESLSNYGTYDLTMTPSNTFGGTDEISPLTMSTAYAAFASGGKVCTPVAIESIVDSKGKNVAFQKANCQEAISPGVAAGVAWTLKYVITNGIARHAASRVGVPHIAKTGTTDNYIDNWTIGGSTRVITATWVGNAGPNPACRGQAGCERVDTRRFGGYSGLTAADQRIWPAVMLVADQKYGGEDFGKPIESAIKQTMVNVPDLSGFSYADAEKTLTDAKFAVRDGGDVDSAQPLGLVARTEPNAGSSQPLGSEIIIYRSRGNAGKVPDGLVGQTGVTAQNALNAAGFSNLQFICSAGSNTPDLDHDPVTELSPAGGSESILNSVVTVSIDCQ